MAKTKKISIRAFDEIVKNTYTPTETVIWHDIEVIIKKTLSFKEMMEFVSNVTNFCFTNDNGTYIPEVKDFVIKCGVIEMYTNISMPENTEHRYKFVYCSDVIPTILKYVNVQQFNEIVQSINNKVENRAQANIEMVGKQMNELYAAFDNLQKQLSDTFSNIGSEDVSKLVEAISDGKLDEGKLVKAYINQTKPKTKQQAHPKIPSGDK